MAGHTDSSMRQSIVDALICLQGHSPHVRNIARRISIEIAMVIGSPNGISLFLSKVYILVEACLEVPIQNHSQLCCFFTIQANDHH